MLVVAGTIEGFFSPSGAPAGLKFAVGAALFTLLLVWLFSSPEDESIESAAASASVRVTAGPVLSLRDSG
jgi:hypothetical protein